MFFKFLLCKIVKEFFLRIYDCFRVYKKIVLYYDVHMFSFWCNNRMYPLNHLTVFHVCMSSRMFVSFYFFALFCELLFSFVKYFSYICKWRVFWDFCLLDAKYIQWLTLDKIIERKKKFLILFINLQFWSLFLESRLQSVSLYLYNLITLYIHVIP